MRTVFTLVQKANKHFKTADHLIYITYPLIQDTRIIITTTENLYKALVNAMDAVLSYDRLYKRISMVPEDFESRFNIFKTNCAKRYNIDRQHILLINDLRAIVEHRKKSPVEFVRRDKFIIANGSYRMKTLTYEKVKGYVNAAKPFIVKINKLFQTYNDKQYR